MSLLTDYKLDALWTKDDLYFYRTWMPLFVCEIGEKNHWIVIILHNMTAVNSFCALVNDWKQRIFRRFVLYYFNWN